MSALSISAAFDATEPTSRPGPRPELRVLPAAPARRASGRVRLTRRGRAVVTLIFLVAALGAMLAFGGLATASLHGGTPEPVRVVEVQPGQTLYDIAGEVAKPGQVREMVYRIQELNSLPSGGLMAGQKIAVPTS